MTDTTITLIILASAVIAAALLWWGFLELMVKFRHSKYPTVDVTWVKPGTIEKLTEES